MLLDADLIRRPAEEGAVVELSDRGIVHHRFGSVDDVPGSRVGRETGCYEITKLLTTIPI